ncbi:DUF1801 domain-containing protein [Actinopolymorpha pittospori]
MVRATATSVEKYLRDLSHPRKGEIEELRAAILENIPQITERVKWNAPSFCVAGDDRITFRLQPGDRVELVFHRGAKKRTDTDTFSFSDPSELIQWSTPDRGIVTFRDHEDVRNKLPALVEVASRWINATKE